jgi:hypothetical protein
VRHMNLASVWLSLSAVGIGLGLAWLMGGPHQALIVLMLIVLEVGLSFNNAVVNATVLRRMSRWWQGLFLTVGLVVAVLGMRLLLPVLMVAVTARVSLGSVVDMALHYPVQYAQALDHARPVIAAFGSLFLLMVWLDFLLDETKGVHWLGWLERPMAKAGRLKTLSVLISLLLLLAMARLWSGSEELRLQIMVAGILGLVTYLSLQGLRRLFEYLGGISAGSDGGRRLAGMTGWAALGLFVYLEVLDATFSFDGVVGAFAISTNVLVIAIGLGVGALVVREFTVMLVRSNALAGLRYLEHGANYSVGLVALLLAVGLIYEVPDVVTGVVGTAVIGWSLVSSLIERRNTSTDPPETSSRSIP